jgi:hypothetical protein
MLQEETNKNKYSYNFIHVFGMCYYFIILDLSSKMPEWDSNWEYRIKEMLQEETNKNKENMYMMIWI